MIVTISFEANSGKRDELVDAMLGLLKDTRAFAGCNSITFTESTETPGHLMLIEDWETPAHYDAYKLWRSESGTSVLSGNLVDKSTLKSASFETLD